MSLKFFEVDKQYINYLKKYENKIMDTANEKEKRPFLGIVLKVYGYDYLVPLTSPKLKHLTMKNQLDFLKIDNGNLGAINFNNMFPVSEKIRFKKNINDEKDVKYKELLKNQLNWCNETKNYNTILKKAQKVYIEITNKKENSFLWSRSCNFKLLEEKLYDYEKEVLKENVGCVKLKLTKEEREKLEKDRINPNYKYIPKQKSNDRGNER